MADTVKIGGKYFFVENPAMGTWRVEAASVPELDDRVKLVRPEDWRRHGFLSEWRGTWDEFLEQWEEVGCGIPEPEPPKLEQDFLDL